MIEVKTKRCNKCNTDKELTEFYKHKYTKDKLFNSCKKCYTTNRINRNKNIKKQIKECDKWLCDKYCNKCKEYKRVDEFYANKRIKCGFTTYCKICHKLNTKKTSKNRIFSKEKRKRDLIRNNFKNILNKYGIFNQLIELQNNKCLNCNDDFDYTDTCKKPSVEHFVPLSKGGKNEINNAMLLCYSCNSSKQAKLPHEFFKNRFESIFIERENILKQLKVSDIVIKKINELNNKYKI